MVEVIENVEKLPKPKAICVLHSWLSSLGVEVRFPQAEEKGDLICKGYSISIQELNNRKVLHQSKEKPLDLQPGEAFCHRCGKRSLNVEKDFGTRPKSKGSVERIRQPQCRGCRGKSDNKSPQLTIEGLKRLDVHKLSHNDPNVAIREIHRFTRAIGLGTPLKARSEELITRMTTNDYEGVSMRLTQFQKTVNPPSHIMRKYQSIIVREAGRAAKRYDRLLRRMSMGADDLVTVAWIYFCNHWNTYAEKHNEGLNEKFLVNSLKQQFGRWYTVTWKKLKNIDSSGSGAAVNEYMGNPVVGGEAEKNHLGEAVYTLDIDAAIDGNFGSGSEEDLTEEQETLRRNEIRRRSTAALEARLSLMPHDSLIETLGDLVNNEFVAHEARKEAAKRLKAHRGSCDSCRDQIQAEAK